MLTRHSTAPPTSHYETFRQSKYFDSLDGLRAISILAVIWYHVPELRPYWRTGYLGVHLFFVISGFLITTLLLREKASNGRISLRNFYVRRTLRIFPAYYLTLLIFLASCYWIAGLHADALQTYLHNLPAFATYTSNWFVYPWGPGHVVFVAAWSLATEEQFYLFWPGIVGRSKHWQTPVYVMLGLIVANQIVKLVYGYWFFLQGPALPIIIINSISTAICAGCLLAYLLDRPTGFAVAWKAMGQWWSAPLFVVLMLVVACIPNDDILLQGHMLVVVLTMVLAVGACVIRRDHLLRPFLANRPIKYIGTISYGLYLYHTFGLNLGEKLFGWTKPWPFLYFILLTLITIIMASLSYFLFEKRFLNLKKRFEVRRHSVLDPEPIAEPILP